VFLSLLLGGGALFVRLLWHDVLASARTLPTPLFCRATTNHQKH